MRVGFVRTDIQRFYLNDVENTSQRCFSSEPRGQSRYFKKATNAQLLTVLNAYAVLSLRGSIGAATFVTTAPANVLKIRKLATSAFTTITVTSGGAVPIATVRDDLNRGFTANSLPFVASIAAGNFIQIDTVVPNSGPSARMELDVVANSTLNAVLGFNVLGVTVTGLPVATVAAAVYPTPVTVDVSDATINALSSFSLLDTTKQTALDDAIADLVAPRLVETGPVLLSFAYGNLSKLRSATFQPGGARVGLPAGIAAYITADDGVTPFVL